jgi:hypothetical protein
VLPLLLYVEAINEAENYENNYKQSGLLDFENFIYLKNQEMGITDNFKKSNQTNHNRDSENQNENDELLPVKNTNFICDVNDIFLEIHNRLLSKDSEIDDETKEKVVDLFYEVEGYYSVYKSFYAMFGGLVKSINKISIIFNIIILILILFMFMSIYFALYNFFINKTLVVNIFLQVQ